MRVVMAFVSVLLLVTMRVTGNNDKDFVLGGNPRGTDDYRKRLQASSQRLQDMLVTSARTDWHKTATKRKGAFTVRLSAC